MAGIIATFVGNSVQYYNGENVARTSASVQWPGGLAVDSSNGDLYVSAILAYRIQVITKSSQLVTTFAGTGSSTYNGDSGAATSISFQPGCLFLDSTDKLYFGEWEHRVRSVYYIAPTMTPSLIPTVVPTTSSPTVIPTTSRPTMMPSTAAPSVIPTASPSTVRSSINTVLVIAGTGTAASSSSGGPATSTSINNPFSVYSDGSTVYFTETYGHCLRKFSLSDSTVVNVAGVCSSSSTFGGDNGPATSAKVAEPHCLFLGTSNDIYFTDYSNHRVRKISNGIITTTLGSGSPTNSGNDFPATSANIYAPYGLWLNSVGTLYVSSYLGCICRTVSTSGIVSLLAGTSLSCSYSGDGASASAANLFYPTFLTGDTSGIVYFSDESKSKYFCVQCT